MPMSIFLLIATNQLPESADYNNFEQTNAAYPLAVIFAKSSCENVPSMQRMCLTSFAMAIIRGRSCGSLSRGIQEAQKAVIMFLKT